jgi:hypothetical protein
MHNMVISMEPPKCDVNYIFERNGNEVYAYESGADPSTRQLIGNTYDPVSGHQIDYTKQTSTGDSLFDRMQEDKMWGEIRRLARTNPTLQDAVERVIMIYRLIKVDK